MWMVTHLLLCGIATHIQEVGRGAPMQLDDVHGGHGQARPIDHAPNAAVQANVVQIIRAGLHIPAAASLCISAL